MQIRLLIATLMLLLAMAGKAQVFQTNNTPMNFTRGLKTRDLLIAPKGCDTTALSNPKWGESTAGALFVDTCNNRLYFYNGLKWNQVTGGGGGGVDSFYYNFRNLNDTTLLWDRGDGVVDTLAFSSGGTSLIGSYVDSIRTVGDSLYEYKGAGATLVANLALSVVGGDTTNLSTVDSTGQPARRVLISAPGNKIASNRFFLYDTTQRKLVIGSAILGAGGSVQLYVQGKIATGSNFIGDTASVNYTGLGSKMIRYNSDSMRVYGLVPITDTGRFKPMVYDATNNTWSYASSWPSGSDTTGLGILYIRNQSATQESKAFNIRSGRLDSLYASGSSGMHFATNSGASAFEYGGGGGTQVTFNGFAGYNANRAASYTARSFTDKNYVDSAIAAGGGGGTPAGSNGQVQFNNSGSFGASSNFNWDNTNNRLGILTASPLRPFHVSGTTQGVLLPRLTTAQKNAISTPQDGEIVYDTDQRNLSTYSGSTSTWIPARSLVGYNSSTASIFVTDGIGAVTGANANNTILQYRTADFPGTGHVIIGRGAATAVSGTPTGLTVVGNDAGYYNSSSYSTLLGQSAGAYTTTGTGSTIVGAYAYAQGSFITGAGNSIFGAFNHRYGVAGAYNSSFGYQTNWFGGGNYNITLGAFVDQQSTTATGYLNIGNVIYGLGLHQSASNSSTPTTGGQIGIGVAQSSISASAKLQVDATDKGFLPPRMTTTQMNAISSPAAGLQLYNSTLSQPHYRDGSTWQAMVGMSFGTAAPTSTPTAVGNFFLDTTNKKLYVATGTASSADWNILN